MHPMYGDAQMLLSFQFARGAVIYSRFLFFVLSRFTTSCDLSHFTMQYVVQVFWFLVSGRVLLFQPIHYSQEMSPAHLMSGLFLLYPTPANVLVLYFQRFCMTIHE